MKYQGCSQASRPVTTTTIALQFGDIWAIQYLLIQISYIYVPVPFHFWAKISKTTI